MPTVNRGHKTGSRKKAAVRIHLVLISAVFIWISACAHYPANQEPPAYKFVQVGQSLHLHENLTILPDKAAVFIQYGKVVPASLIDQWAPSCRVVVQGITDSERVIQPDVFTIIEIRYESYLAFMNPIMIASRKFGSSMDGNGPIAEVYAISFYINSAKQPFVKQLTCKYWEDPHDGSHLTLKQIRLALGTIIEYRE